MRVARALLLLAVLGCSRRAEPVPEEPATFVDIVWKVERSSSVAPGQRYVFLSEGTLVVASPHGKPSLGTWTRQPGGLTMVEDGIPYACEILGLSKTEFRIRSHNPGEPVEITLVPADGSPPALPQER